MFTHPLTLNSTKLNLNPPPKFKTTPVLPVLYSYNIFNIEYVCMYSNLIFANIIAYYSNIKQGYYFIRITFNV